MKERDKESFVFSICIHGQLMILLRPNIIMADDVILFCCPRQITAGAVNAMHLTMMEKYFG